MLACRVACPVDTGFILDRGWRGALRSGFNTVRICEENTLAHSRSSRKRWRQSLERRDRNRSVKSRTRTVLNKALAAIGQDASVAEPAVKAAVSALDRAAQKGVIHPNAASRGKSRLLKRYNLATATAVAAAAAKEPAAEEKPAGTKRRAVAAKKPAAAKKPTAAKADTAAKKPAATKAAAAKKADPAPAKRATRSKASEEKETEEKPAAERAPRTRARKTT